MNMSIEYKTSEEITMMLTPAKAPGYLVLTGDMRQEVRSFKGRYEYKSVLSYVLYLGEKAGRRNDLPIERDFVAKVSLPFCVSSGEELLVLSRMFDAQIHQQIGGANDAEKMSKPTVGDDRVAKLADLELVLTKSMIDASEEEIKKVYPYPFTMMADEELKKIITTGFSNYVLPLLIWSDTKFRWSLMPVSLVDAYPLADSRMLSVKPALGKKKFEANTQFLSSQKNKGGITTADLKSLAGMIKKTQEE